MRSFSVLLLLSSCVLGCGKGPEKGASPESSRLMTRYLAGLDRLDSALAALDTAVARAPDPPGGGPQQAFRQARADYKRIEFLVEYYSPRLARDLNGPALPRTEDEDLATPRP